MFSQKKKRKKGWLFFIPIAFILAIGLWLNNLYNQDNADSHNTADFSTGDSITDDGTTEKNAQLFNDNSTSENKAYMSNNAETEDESINDDTDDYNNDLKNNSNSNSDVNTDKNYILLIMREHIIYEEGYDSNNNLLWQSPTSINYEMLPEYDRENLTDGIILHSQAELEELLQDFEE